MSPKDFRDSLLTTVGNLSDWTASQPAHFQEVIDGVCDAKGINPDDYGVRDADGKKWVEIWIRLAFRWAKRENLAMQADRNKAGKEVKRGWWALTEAGVKKAAEIAGVDIATVAAVDDDSKPTEPENGVSVIVGPGNADEGYHVDPYIRALAASKTECYGHYSPKAPTCSDCGLSGGCQNFVAAVYSTLAAELAREDALEAEKARLAAEETEKAAEEAIIRPPITDPTLPPPDTLTGEPLPTTAPTPPPGGWDNSNSQRIVSFVKSTCCRCGQEIPKGIKCFWIKDGAQKGGMYHLSCE